MSKEKGSRTMKRNIRTLLVLIFGLSFKCNKLISMEEKVSTESNGSTPMDTDEESILHSLPLDLQAYLLPFLGTSVTELIDNINRLSLVDTYFTDFIKTHRELLKKQILKRFGLMAIKNHLNKVILSGDLKLVRLFGIYALDQVAVNNSIFSAMRELLRKKLYNRIAELFDRNIMAFDNPVYDNATPLKHILSSIRSDEKDQEKFKEFLRYLITHKHWNINSALDSAGNETPFSRALVLMNVPLVQFLLEQGADMNDPINVVQLQRTIQTIKLKFLDRGLMEEERNQVQLLLDVLKNYELVKD